MQGLLVLGAALFALSARPCSAQESESAMRERVKREYPGALARLEEFYGQVSGTALLTTYSPRLKSGPIDPKDQNASRYEENAPPDVVTRVQRISFSVCDGMEKIHTVVEVDKVPYSSPTAEYKDRPRGPTRPKEAVACRGSDYFFRLDWVGDRRAPVLVEHGKKSEGPLSPMFDSLLRSPFSFLSEPISRTMSSGALSIEGITRVESQGRECLKINYRVDSSRLEWEGTAKAASKAGWGRGWIVVSPDDGWVIHEFVTFPENSPERRAVKRITYGVKEHGITVPTRVENLAAHRLSVLEIETLRHGQTPANEFTLAHYGLPNLDEPSTKTYQSRLGYWFVALGLLALGLVGALKWPRKTRRGTDAAPPR